MFHLGRAGPHGVQARRGHHPQEGVHDELALLHQQIQGGDDLHFFRRDGQLLKGLPEGAVPGRLPRLHSATGETYFSRLVSQRAGPHFKEQAQALRALNQRRQYRVFLFHVLHLRHMARPAGPEIAQRHSVSIQSQRVW